MDILSLIHLSSVQERAQFLHDAMLIFRGMVFFTGFYNVMFWAMGMFEMNAHMEEFMQDENIKTIRLYHSNPAISKDPSRNNYGLVRSRFMSFSFIYKWSMSVTTLVVLMILICLGMMFASMSITRDLGLEDNTSIEGFLRTNPAVVQIFITDAVIGLLYLIPISLYMLFQDHSVSKRILMSDNLIHLKDYHKQVVNSDRSIMIWRAEVDALILRRDRKLPLLSSDNNPDQEAKVKLVEEIKEMEDRLKVLDKMIYSTTKRRDKNEAFVKVIPIINRALAKSITERGSDYYRPLFANYWAARGGRYKRINILQEVEEESKQNTFGLGVGMDVNIGAGDGAGDGDSNNNNNIELKSPQILNLRRRQKDQMDAINEYATLLNEEYNNLW